MLYIDLLSYDNFIKVLFAKADKTKTPFSGAFELTSRCTLDCKMCYIHSLKESADYLKSQEKPTSWWCDLIRTCRDRGMLITLLTGGEPTLREDFSDIYKYTKKLGLVPSVNTNATLMNDELIKLFADLPPQKISVTLYGTSKETYKNLCGNESAYDRVVDSIKELKKAGVSLKLNFSMTPYNINDALEALKFAKSLDLNIQPVSYMFPPIRRCGGECASNVRLSPEDAATSQFKWNLKMYGEEAFKKYLEFSREKEINYDGVCNDRINCHAGLSSFWVTWKGELTPCGMLSQPKILIDDFDESWRYITTQRENIHLPMECVNCNLKKHCDMCAAVSKAETGEFKKVPSYACRKAHKYFELTEELVGSR